MKKITIIWMIIMLLLVFLLIVLGINISKKKAPYVALENDIIDAMKVYYGQDSNLVKLPKKNKTARVTIGELESYGLNINNIINGDNCDGYGIVTGKDVAFSYKAYIKCNDYKTKGYSD